MAAFLDIWSQQAAGTSPENYVKTYHNENKVYQSVLDKYFAFNNVLQLMAEWDNAKVNLQFITEILRLLIEKNSQPRPEAREKAVVVTFEQISNIFDKMGKLKQDAGACNDKGESALVLKCKNYFLEKRANDWRKSTKYSSLDAAAEGFNTEALNALPASIVASLGENGKPEKLEMISTEFFMRDWNYFIIRLDSADSTSPTLQRLGKDFLRHFTSGYYGGGALLREGEGKVEEFKKNMTTFMSKELDEL